MREVPGRGFFFFPIFFSFLFYSFSSSSFSFLPFLSCLFDDCDSPDRIKDLKSINQSCTVNIEQFFVFVFWTGWFASCSWKERHNGCCRYTFQKHDGRRTLVPSIELNTSSFNHAMHLQTRLPPAHHPHHTNTSVLNSCAANRTQHLWTHLITWYVYTEPWPKNLD